MQTISKTVREIVLETPHAARVFESLGLDYCCGGNRPLDEACAAAHLSVDEVVRALEEAAKSPSAPQKEWPAESLGALIDHIQSTHHVFTRSELTRIRALLDKVCGVHGKNHPELNEVREVFLALAQELTTHLMKEEMVLFPYIGRMEESVLQKEPVLPAPFGTVENPIHAMMQEHDTAGDALRRIRELTHSFSAPEDACVSYRMLYEALKGFEADLHQHIHLENNLLFPRAAAMERSR